MTKCIILIKQNVVNYFICKFKKIIREYLKKKNWKNTGIKLNIQCLTNFVKLSSVYILKNIWSNVNYLSTAIYWSHFNLCSTYDQFIYIADIRDLFSEKKCRKIYVMKGYIFEPAAGID